MSLDAHADGWTLRRESAPVGEIRETGDELELRAREGRWTTELTRPPFGRWRLMFRMAIQGPAVGVYLPRRVGAGGTLTLGGDDRWVLNGPWIFSHWIITQPAGAELARIKARPGDALPEHRPLTLGPAADSEPTATLIVLAACVAVITSEQEPRCVVADVPAW